VTGEGELYLIQIWTEGVESLVHNEPTVVINEL
jgi:hypothetical protein